MKGGIYKILCWSTNKFYIGNSSDIKRRFVEHRKNLRGNKHPNSYLQAAWNKYSELDFSFHILEYCENELLVEREQYYLNTTLSHKREFGYNFSPTAHSNLGAKFSEQARQNMSKSHIGKTHSNETKSKMSSVKLGKKRPEVGAAISKAKKGKRTGKKPPEQLEKMRIAQQKRRSNEKLEVKFTRPINF